MPISQVTAITYQNQWSGSQGIMHTSSVTLSDGVCGTANHKNQAPPYKVGETVEYQITGDFRGVPKLKIGKPQSQGQQGGYQQPAQPATQPPMHNAGNGQQSGFHGATVGMAINQGCEFARSLNKGFDKPFIYETASALLRLSQKLEMGLLSPLPGQPAPQSHPAPPPPQPSPPPQRPRPGPEGSAFPQDSHPDFESSDVPF